MSLGQTGRRPKVNRTKSLSLCAFFLPEIRKILMPIIFPPAILGPEMAAPIYGRLACLGSFCWKNPMPIKFLVLGGRGFLEGGGGGSANFVFMGVRIFLMKEFSTILISLMSVPECTTPSHSQSLANFVANIHSQGISAARTKFSQFHSQNHSHSLANPFATRNSQLFL